MHAGVKQMNAAQYEISPSHSALRRERGGHSKAPVDINGNDVATIDTHRSLDGPFFLPPAL